MKRFLLALLFGAAFAFDAGAQTFTVPIQNPSFESPVPTQGEDVCGQTLYGPPGWYASGGNGALVIANLSSRPCDFSSPPDGIQMIVILNGSISQNLGDVSKMPFADQNGGVDGDFTFSFFVANSFYWYPGQFYASVSLYCQAGNTLCEQGTTKTLCSSSGWGRGDFRQIVMLCPSQRQYGELIITLGSGVIGATGGFYQNNFDKVSMSFLPAT